MTHIVWGNIAPQLISGSLNPGKTSWTTYDVHGASQIWHVTAGTTIRIPQSLYTMDGKVHDVIVKIDSWGNKLHDNQITIWNQNGAINYVQDGIGVRYNNNTIRVSYGVDQLESSQPYYWFNAESDVDEQQRASTGDGSNVMVLSVGGDLHVNASNGRIDVKSTGTVDLKGFDSAPNGVVVYAAYTPTFVKQLSDDGGMSWAIADADFGVDLKLNIPVAPTPKYTDVSYHSNKIRAISN